MLGFQPVRQIDPVTPAPSLLTAARALPDVDWRTGVAWNPASCAPSHNWARCPEPDTTKEEPADTRGAVHTDAFMIYTPLACDWTVSGSGLDSEAEALTGAHSAFGVARALWLGDGLPDDPDQPTLRRNATDVSISGAAADTVDAFAVLLSQYEQCTGGNGGAVLHVPSVLIPEALKGDLIRAEGNLYRGPLGSVVSPGPGYPHGASAAGADGFGPLTDDGPPEVYAGNDLDEVWIYVTGPVEYALGDVIVLPEDEASRRGLGHGRANTYEVWGERPAIVRFDPCCVFAALATNPAGEVS